MGKSSKQCCVNQCAIECCKPDCEVDCCSAAFLRLDKLRQGWTDVATSGGTNMITTIIGSTGPAPSYPMLFAWVPATLLNRAGSAVSVPIGDTGVYPSGTSASIPSIFGTGSTGAPVVNLIQTVGAGPTGATNIDILTDGNVDILNNALYAYNFVNTMRYQSFEACGKADQVVGWLVNTSTGQLELFQALPDLNLSLTDNRGQLIAIAKENLTSVQKQKLYNLNVLYKVSQDAVARVAANPKEEGNICEFTDKCGQKWLLAINRADSQAPVISAGSQFVIVGVPLC